MKKIELNSDKLREAYLVENLTLPQMAERFGCSVSVIQRNLKKIGATKIDENNTSRRRGQHKEAAFSCKEELEELYINQNLSANEIAELKGISKDGVRKYIKKWGFVKEQDKITEAQRTGLQNKYGVNNSIELDWVRQKMEQTCLERHGYTNPLRSKEVQERARATQKKIRDARREANAERIAEERRKKEARKRFTKKAIYKLRPQKGPRMKELFAEGRPTYGTSKNSFVIKRIKKVSKPHYRNERARKAMSSREELAKVFNEISPRTTYGLSVHLDCGWCTVVRKLRKFGLWDMVQNSGSQGEKQVRDFLEAQGIRCERTRTVIPPYEVDIYCSDYGIAIEYNGTYWHSEKKHESTYHQKKSLEAEKRGIQLYHIFEHEWDDPIMRPRIENQLLNMFKKNKVSIYARECEIREVSVEDKRVFLEENHLQGNDRSVLRYGLYYNDVLVSLMTFCKPRFLKKSHYDWELSRFCSLSGTNVVGGATKLFKHFLKNNEGSVISYSNFTKTKGTLYGILGFKFVRLSEPNYVWTNGHDVLTRYQTQTKNEIETMTSKGYYRIFDCGSKVWVYER